MNSMNHQSQNMKTCIQECLSCHSICLESIQHCLSQGGKHAAVEHIQLLRDCAEICQTSADFMLSGSTFHSRTCSVCAEVCNACEQSCRAFSGDQQMKLCADACRRCADSCLQMSGGSQAAA